MAVTKVVMPKLSDAMESGKIIKWLKKEGDRIQGGDILAEVETDKADVEMEAFGAGVLRKILIPAGSSAPIGTLIGVIAEPGDDITALVASAPAGGAGAGSGAQKTPLRPEPAPAAPAPAASAASQAPHLAAATPAPAPVGSAARPAAVVSAPAAAPAGIGQGAQGGRVKASPLAKKIAAQAGVDLRLAFQRVQLLAQLPRAVHRHLARDVEVRYRPLGERHPPRDRRPDQRERTILELGSRDRRGHRDSRRDARAGSA